MGILPGARKGVYSVTEHDIQALIMLELSKYGTVFRTNAGQAYQGARVYSHEFRQEVLIDLRMVHGLPKGFSDLMLIYKGGRAAFVEVKAPHGRLREDQKNFIDRMSALGCRAGVARTVNDALNIIKEDRNV